ncbi:UNVERIFIED_ORG: hypothetical protein ABRZ91_001124 [Heyndrickxia coagulans]
MKECFRIFPDLPGPFFRFVAMVPLTGYTKRTRFVNVLFCVFQAQENRNASCTVALSAGHEWKMCFPSPAKWWKGLAEPS